MGNLNSQNAAGLNPGNPVPGQRDVSSPDMSKAEEPVDPVQFAEAQLKRRLKFVQMSNPGVAEVQRLALQRAIARAYAPSKPSSQTP